MEAAHRTAAKPGERAYASTGLSADDDLGIPALREVSFDVRAGEIVGIAGVAGNGQEELVEVLAGQRAATAGKLWVHGREYLASREETAATACAVCRGTDAQRLRGDDDRGGEHRLSRTSPPALHRGGRRSASRAIRDNARRAIAELKIKTPSTPDAAISQHVGGNVQRAVLARELGGEVEVLIAANRAWAWISPPSRSSRRGWSRRASPERRAPGERPTSMRCLPWRIGSSS